MPKTPEPQIYEVLPADFKGAYGLNLHATPDSKSPVLQTLAPTLLVRRLNTTVYPDVQAGTGNQYFYIAVANNLVGYAVGQVVDVNNVTTIVGLGQTVSAVIAQAQFDKILEKRQDSCKKKCSK